MALSIIPVLSLLTVILAGFEGTQPVEYIHRHQQLPRHPWQRHFPRPNRCSLRQANTGLCNQIHMRDLPAEFSHKQKNYVKREPLRGRQRWIGICYRQCNEIHLSSRYVGSCLGDVRREVTGVLYHEMTHIWQWNGNAQANGGLSEGIADYVRLKVGYAPSHWVKPGQVDQWGKRSDVTANFPDYCNSLRNGFLAEMNKKIRARYGDNYVM